MGKAIVLANVLLYLCIVALGARDVYFMLFAHAPEGVSALRLDAFAIRALIVLPTLVCIFGLARRARWGLSAAVVWNIVLVLMLVVVPFAGSAAFVGLDQAWAILSWPSVTLALSAAALAVVLRGNRVQRPFPTRG